MFPVSPAGHELKSAMLAMCNCAHAIAVHTQHIAIAAYTHAL